MEIFVSQITGAMAVFLPKFLLAIFVFVVSLYLARLTKKPLEEVLQKRNVDQGAIGLLVEAVRWGIILFGTVFALQQFVDVATFLAGLGLLGFTVGFALQDVMKNFAAGVLILLQRPFVVGDAITVKEFDGSVIAIDLRSTELRTWDGRIVILPNADVINNAIINYTRSVLRRLEVPVGVAYETDLKLAQQVILETMQQMPGVLEEPAPFIVVNAFGESSIDLSAFYWIDTTQTGFLDGKNTGFKTIKAALDEHGIDIPFPIRTVLMPTKDIDDVN